MGGGRGELYGKVNKPCSWGGGGGRQVNVFSGAIGLCATSNL